MSTPHVCDSQQLDNSEFCTNLNLPPRIYGAGTEPPDTPKLIIHHSKMDYASKVAEILGEEEFSQIENSHIGSIVKLARRTSIEFSRLPFGFLMNISHIGLKRALVSEGISVEIREAQAISLFHSSSRRFATVDIKEGGCSCSSLGSMCVPLPPIQIIRSASLVAFRTPEADSQIKTSYLSDETIQLLPEKCYDKAHTYKQYYLPSDLLGLKIEKLENAQSSLGGNGTAQRVSSVSAKLKASGMVRFQLEIERRIGSNETETSKRAECRTKPKIESVWFEVKAKVEGDKLKAVGMRKVVPFFEVDTEAWSSMMSNMPFTKFPSILGLQEALTLDFKW